MTHGTEELKIKMILVDWEDFYHDGADDGILILDSVAGLHWDELRYAPLPEWRPRCFGGEPNMTEDRALRITFEDGKDFGRILDAELDPIYVRRVDTEPLPPKEWHPRCFGGEPNMTYLFSCRNLCPWYKECKEKAGGDTH